MRYWLSLFLLFYFVPIVLPGSNFQLPVNKRDVQPFHLNLMAKSHPVSEEKGLDEVFPVGPRGAKFHLSLESEITITGKDATGNDWSVELNGCHIGLGYELFSGDLDANGYPDAILITYTGANGFLPSAIISIITFDEKGRPILLQDGQNAEAGEHGVLQIVDIDNDDKAELIATHYDSEDGKDKWDGYYIANIYKVKNARWSKLKQFAGYSLPIVTHYSFEDKGDYLIRKPESLAVGRRPSAPDLCNDLPTQQGTIIQSNGFTDLARFKVWTSQKKTVSAVRKTWDKCYLNAIILVVETQKVRSIRSLMGVNGRIDMREINNQKGELFGNCSPGLLSPNTIWVTK